VEEWKMNNNIVLKLDEKLKYNLLDLEKKLHKELHMSVNSPSSKNNLEYDGCEIQISDNNRLWLQTDYFFANVHGKYINHSTSDILRVIESWTKDVFDGQDK
jgi:hypothetical protein